VRNIEAICRLKISIYPSRSYIYAVTPLGRNEPSSIRLVFSTQ